MQGNKTTFADLFVYILILCVGYIVLSPIEPSFLWFLSYIFFAGLVLVFMVSDCFVYSLIGSMIYLTIHILVWILFIGVFPLRILWSL